MYDWKSVIACARVVVAYATLAPACSRLPTDERKKNNDTASEIIGMMTTRTTTKHTYADAKRLMLLKWNLCVRLLIIGWRERCSQEWNGRLAIGSETETHGPWILQQQSNNGEWINVPNRCRETWWLCVHFSINLVCFSYKPFPHLMYHMLNRHVMFALLLSIIGIMFRSIPFRMALRVLF